jgi:hypothetical protein
MGRVIERATISDKAAATTTPASAASSRSTRNGRQADDWTLDGRRRSRPNRGSVRYEYSWSSPRYVVSPSLLLLTSGTRLTKNERGCAKIRTLPETSFSRM